MKSYFDNTKSITIKLQPEDHQTKTPATFLKSEKLPNDKVKFVSDLNKVVTGFKNFEADYSSLSFKKRDQNYLSTSTYSSSYTDVEMKLVNKSLLCNNNSNTLSSPRSNQYYNNENLKNSNNVVNKVFNEKHLPRNRHTSIESLSLEFHKVKNVRRSSLKTYNTQHRIELKFSSDSKKNVSPSYNDGENGHTSKISLRRKLRFHNRRSVLFQILTPLQKLQRVTRVIRLLIRCLRHYKRVSVVSHVSQMSFAMMSNEIVKKKNYRYGLTFDPSDFKANSENQINDLTRNILTIVPEHRTSDQVEYAIKRMRASVDEFSEFPRKMQEEITKVAWLDQFEPKRIIIRQGHQAQNFYFILSGTALITKNRLNSHNEAYVETVSILKKGKTFGELAILRNEKRNYNVVSQTNILLLTVCRKDFLKIFIHRMDESETDLLDFLRCLPELKGYPLHKLPKNKPTLFAFTYFRIGMVICSDSRKNDYIIIIKSGFCKVIKKVQVKTPKLHESVKFKPNSKAKEKIKLESSENVFLNVATLGQNDIFGLSCLLFKENGKCSSFSLVSQGAECILINKNYFVRYLNSELKERLIRIVRPYPTDEVLDENMQTQVNWDAYKYLTLKNFMAIRNKLSSGFFSKNMQYKKYN